MGLIIVDVDGVINKFRPNKDDKWVRAVFPEGASYNIWYDPAMVEDLKNLAEETNWQLIWGTTWNNHANTILAPEIGFPELPVIDIGTQYIKRSYKFSEYVTTGEFKAWSALAQIEEPFVWFDDMGYDIRKTLKTYKDFDFPYLIVCCSDLTGVTEEDIEKARNWIGLDNKEVP